MKKKIYTILILSSLLCISSILFGCGNNTKKEPENISNEENIKTKNNENETESDKSDIFEVNKVVYNSSMIELSCNNITTNYIEFTCKNKTDKNIDIFMYISLDGIVYPTYGSDTIIQPNSTSSFMLNGTFETLEHEVMSLCGNVFVDGTGIEEFDICDFKLGGKRNEKTLEEGNEDIYSSDNLQVSYIGADAQGLNFYVNNKRQNSITIGFEEFFINDDDENYGHGVTSIPANSQTIYHVNILSYNKEYFSDDINKFSGIMYTSLNHEMADRFPISYSIENNALSNNNNNDQKESNYNNGVKAYNNKDYEKCQQYMEMASGYSDADSYLVITQIINNSNDYINPEEIDLLNDLRLNGFKPAEELSEKTPFKELLELQNYNGNMYASSPFERKNQYMQYEVTAYIKFNNDDILCGSLWDVDIEDIDDDSLQNNKNNYESAYKYDNNSKKYKASITFKDMFGSYVAFYFDFYFDNNQLIIESLETTEDDGEETITIGTYNKVE